MTVTDHWLAEYGDRHRNIPNPLAYWPGALSLVIGTVGMLWSLPVPEAFVDISPLLNWGSAFLMAAVIYYFILSIALAIGMLPFVVGVSVLQFRLVAADLPLSGVSVVLFALGVTGLYVGRHAAGGLRAVFSDIQLMMIGPAWLLAGLYRRLGIPY